MALNKPQAESVQIFDNGIPLGTVTTQVDGTWSYTATELGQGAHNFIASVNGVTSNTWVVNVEQEAMNLIAPHFLDATAVAPEREQINYYAREGDGYVQIRAYGAQIGDTVRVTWIGRNITIPSEIQTVTNPANPLTFKISMYEIIDCIGANATIRYTVVRPPSTEVHRSQALSLTVMGHSGAIEAPTLLKPNNNELHIKFVSEYYSARARFIGLTSVDSDIFEFHGKDIDIPIKASWLLENRGRPVLFNWSLRRDNNDQTYYSQILRVDNL